MWKDVLFTEGGIDKNNKWFKKVSHIPYKYLRKSWQKLLLDIIKPLEDESMPELVCPNCRAKFEHKKTDNR